jgi:hypothetical protein
MVISYPEGHIPIQSTNLTHDNVWRFFTWRRGGRSLPLAAHVGHGEDDLAALEFRKNVARVQGRPDPALA